MKIIPILFLYYAIISIKSIEVYENENIIMNIYYSNETNNFIIETSNYRDKDAVASAIYNKSYEKIGWDYLSISSYDKKDYKYNDSIKSYSMGYLEGVLTKDRIYSHYCNFYHYFLYDFNYNEEIQKIFFGFLEMNIEYMKNKSFVNMDSDPYWEHVYYVYQQLLGIYDGYMSVGEEEERLPFSKFLVLPAMPDSNKRFFIISRSIV